MRGENISASFSPQISIFPLILDCISSSSASNGNSCSSIPAGASEPSAWFTLQLPLPRTSLGQFKERNDGEISTSTPLLACHLSLKHTQRNSNPEPGPDTSLISIVLAVLLWIFPL